MSSSARAKSIARPSKAFASFSSQDRGFFCEKKVLQHYQSLGYSLVRSRWKTPFAEVDLLLQSADMKWLMVEVKSLQKNHWSTARISRGQKQRLRRAFSWALKKYPQIAGFHLVYVRGDEKIEVITRFLT